MSTDNVWERFFDAHARAYDANSFTKNTAREVAFLLEELALPQGASLLDVGCGTGRHAIALARHGFAVTGLDLSEAMLAVAADKAAEEGVTVRWVRADATDFSFTETFDAAVCLCEGAFGLLGGGDDPIEQPLSILRNIARCLKPGGRVLLTMLSGITMARGFTNDDVDAGRFDPLTLVSSSEVVPRKGLAALRVRERAFAPTELPLLCRLAGLELEHLWGGTAGNWGRRTLDLDEFEIMMVARKA